MEWVDLGVRQEDCSPCMLIHLTIVVLSNNIFSLLYKVQSLKIWSLMGVVMRHPNAKQQSVWRKVSIQSQA